MEEYSSRKSNIDPKKNERVITTHYCPVKVDK